MAPFDPDVELTHDLGYRLVQNSFVTMFRGDESLHDATGWLAEHGYQLVTLDAGGWSDHATMHRDLAAALSFPDYYGANLDAFNDCLGDVVVGDYGSDPAATGLVLVLRHYDGFARREPRVAHALLDIIAGRARHGALFGRRVLCLVHSDTPGLQFPPVGASPVLWFD